MVELLWVVLAFVVGVFVGVGVTAWYYGRQFSHLATDIIHRLETEGAFWREPSDT